MTGLQPAVWRCVYEVFAKYPAVEEVVLYGSRAKGNYRSGSDIDLSLKGQGLNLKMLNKISNELDDLLLPYTFDLSIYNQIENPGLIEHIDRVGKIVYRQQLDEKTESTGVGSDVGRR